MSAKKGRGAKVAQKAKQIQESIHSKDDPNLSAIERASFLEGLLSNDGAPLHSTAMDEDLNAIEEKGTKKGKSRNKTSPKTMKPAAKRREGAVKRKGTGREEEKENTRKRKRKSTEVKVKASPEKVKQMKKDKKVERDLGRGKSRKAQSQEDESDTGTTLQRRQNIPSSDEEIEDDDLNWTPVSKKAEVLRSGRKSSSDESDESTGSSSGSNSAEVRKAKTDNPKRKRRGDKGATEFDVVLDAFLNFCNEYRESVESEAVKQSIDAFSSSVKGQLLEQISSYKEFRALKRENTKVGSLIRTKSKRLLDAKYELMREKRKACQLHKEKAALKLRLADLQRGQAFLHDIRGLYGQYLDFRHKHPKEEETYGSSSLPALLLETKHIKSAERQPRRINNRTGSGLKKNGK